MLDRGEKLDDLVETSKEISEQSKMFYKTVRCLYLCVLQHQTLEAMLNRGEKLDDLVAKSEDLSGQSKAFYTTVSNVLNLCMCVSG